LYGTHLSWDKADVSETPSLLCESLRTVVTKSLSISAVVSDE
jgi:hypothetical protein